MNYILSQYHKYPLCKFDDIIKQAYQAEFGLGHILGENARDYLFAEAAEVTAEDGDLYDVISSRFARVHLAEYVRRGYSLNALYYLMKIAEPLSGTQGGMEERLNKLQAMVDERLLDFSPDAVHLQIAAYKHKGCPPIHHSSGYKVNYRPHYRLVCANHARYLPVIAKVYELLEKQNVVFVAVDGFCGSGKTYLAKLLSELWDAEIIHADDFFLPPAMRTEARLSEVGGNIHYERLAETLKQAEVHRPFDYFRYDCRLGSFVTKHFTPKRLVIVEGTYVLREDLARHCDVKVQLVVSKLTQASRLIAREGSAGYEVFKNRWIPLENRYFDLIPEEDERIIIDTTEF